MIALLDMAREKAVNPDRLDLAIDVRGDADVLLRTRISLEVSETGSTDA